MCIPGISQSKGSIGKDKLVAAVKDIVMSHINAPEAVLRCTSANALGKMAQARLITLCYIISQSAPQILGSQFAQATMQQVFEKVQVLLMKCHAVA